MGADGDSPRLRDYCTPAAHPTAGGAPLDGWGEILQRLAPRFFPYFRRSARRFSICPPRGSGKRG
ncbi:hypothetical protein DB347_00355 [Opitutaceae bacterium EW11]|nr:hypothetical protein DB347_00355 [Opitutaceae bacterium EW11]